MAPVHVYPINDIYPHNTESQDCPCRPKIEYRGRDEVVIHNSWDLREDLELFMIPQAEPVA